MHPMTKTQIAYVLTMLVLLALWVTCIVLLMEATRSVLDVLHAVIELAQLS